MLTNALIVGYRNSVITTIEKRFEFSSVLSGVLSGCLEFGSLIATLLISYFFTKSHIPRAIAFSSFFCAIGSLLYALPHYLSKPYTLNNINIHKTTDDLICKIVHSKKLLNISLVEKCSMGIIHNVMHKYALFMHNIGNSLCIMSIRKPNANLWHLFAEFLCIF